VLIKGEKNKRLPSYLCVLNVVHVPKLSVTGEHPVLGGLMGGGHAALIQHIEGDYNKS
jgi:hypothetical protein